MSSKVAVTIDSDSESTGPISHFFHGTLLGHYLSREPSADRYIRLPASNPLPLLFDK
jgi:hypothetical protein